MRWNESVTLEFVKIYLKHECLWNPSHPNYKLKYQREKAYSDICNEFKASTMKSLTTLEVKLKIKNLRTTYVQQVHKILEKSSPDLIYEPSLIWFHEMDQCLKNISTYRFSASYQNSQKNTEVDSSSQIWVDQQLTIDNTQEIHIDPLVPQRDNDNQIIEMPQSYHRSKRKQSPLHFKRNKKKLSKHKPTTDYFTDSNSETPSKPYEKEKEDEFDIYGKYIATQLRNMDIKKALKLQLEFQSLVSEARISEMSD